jgi:hypothetical protein
VSLGTILLIILIIVLLGGFSGFGGGPFYGIGLLRRRWARPRNSYSVDLGSVRLSSETSQNQLPALLMELIGSLAIITMKSLQCI